MRHIAFRVDASTQIGSGHLVRCLTLADGLKQRGVELLFISRFLPIHFRDMLARKGHSYEMLAGGNSDSDGKLAHSKWLGASQVSDAMGTAQKLSGKVWDWLVVDHYALDIDWELVLRRSVRNIMVIDDLADRQHDCDILLDQNVFPNMYSRYVGKIPAHCRVLLGPRYVLLREEFRQRKYDLKLSERPVKRALITFGGIDSANYTGFTIQTLCEHLLGMQSVDVVVGEQHPFLKKIELDCMKFGYSFHQQTEKMAELMFAADLAIGACGFTCYELAAMQVPAILIPATKIQEIVAMELASKGLIYALFPGGRNMAQEMLNLTDSLINETSLRISMIKACRELVDSDGASRVVDELCH